MPAKGVVLGGDTGLGQGIEEGGLADVGQADDSAFEAHGVIPVRFFVKRLWYAARAVPPRNRRPPVLARRAGSGRAPCR